MSIRDVMTTEEAINLAALPAGMGDFRRTLAERSSVSYRREPKQKGDCALSKFIAPTDGVYKITFEYAFYTSSSSLSNAQLQLYLDGGPSSYSTGGYYSGSSASIATLGNIDANWYYDTNLGDNISRKTSSYRITVLNLSAPLSFSNTVTWKTATLYFNFKKGDVYVLQGTIDNSWDNVGILTTSFRNFKVTY